MEKNQKSSAEEMLRQLRMRYTDTTPEDVFSDATAVKDEDEVAFDDEISEKFNSLFGEAAVVVAPEEPIEEPAAQEEHVLPVHEDEDAVPMEDVESAVQEDEPDEESEDEDEPREVDEPHEVVQPEEHGDPAEQTPAVVAPESVVPTEPETQGEGVTPPAQSPTVSEQEGEDAVTVPQAQEEQPLDAAPAEQADAPQESNEGESVAAEQTTQPPEEVAPQESAPETEEEQIDPVVLREDEILLDEFEEVPPEALVSEQAESEPAAVEAPSTPAAPVAPVAPAVEQPPVPAPVKPRPSPLDAALQAQRKKETAQPSHRAPALREAETLSDEDVALLISLGYENELTRRMDSDRIERIKREPLATLTDRQRANRASGYPGREYGGSADNDAVKAAYKKSRGRCIWRLVLTLLFALLTLAWDVAPYFAAYLPSVVTEIATSPVSHLLGLQLLVLTVAPSLHSVWYGVRQLFRLSPEPASAVAPVLLVTALYDVLVTFLPERVIALNVPAALLMVLLVVGEWMDVCREITAFSVISGSEAKVTLCELEPRKKKVVRDGRIVKIINDQIDTKLYAVNKTARIDGYFRRTNEPTPRFRSISYLLGVQLVVALLVAGISMLNQPSLLSAGTTFVLCMQLCAPGALLISYAYPMLLATRRLAAKKATILGYGTPDAMAGERTLVFDDTEMLQAKSSTEITVKGGGDPRKFVRYARRLFHAVGGTLGKITTSDLSEDLIEGGVEILRVSSEGLEAKIDGRVRVLVGTSAFMVKNNVRVPKTTAELLARKNDESSILYLAFGGQIRLGYEINYRIHGNFEQMVAALGAGKTAVAIRSCDPNLTDDYLAASRAHRKHPVAVFKPVRHEAGGVSESEDCGVVATGSAKNIAHAVRMCDLLLTNDRQLSVMQRIMMVAGSLAVVVLSLTGLLAQNVAVVAAVLQLIFCLPVAMLSRKNLWLNGSAAQEPQKDKKNENNDKK